MKCEWPYCLPKEELLRLVESVLTPTPENQFAGRSTLCPHQCDQKSEPSCDGLCVYWSDIDIPTDEDMVVYPHPSCPLHAPGQVCECGAPDCCLSPTHGEIND